MRRGERVGLSGQGIEGKGVRVRGCEGVERVKGCETVSGEW